jgi:hypothetical protein
MSSAQTSEILHRAEFFDLEGALVPVVAKADLIQAKKEANRPKDRIDLEELQNSAPESSIKC